jgi:hypothetical protein
MTQPEHLTEEQFAHYQARTMAPAELLAVDDHVANCGDCRGRLYRAAQADTLLRQLKADLAEHLEYDQVAACANGIFPPEVAQHLKECERCRAEVDDLTQFRAELEATPRAPIRMPVRRVPWRLAAAAAVVLAAGLTVWYGRQTTPRPVTVAVVPQQPAEAALSPEQNQLLQLALTSHKLERAPILGRLITRRGVLLGPPPDAKGFELTGPMGTAVVTDRPTFEWRPAEGATKYVVAIFDENFEKVMESGVIVGSEWRPERALARGRIYNWQVSATIGGKTVHAPTPPAPEARFQVVAQEMADGIESARREHPENHTLLAALYAQAGAVEDAGKELDRLAASDPTAAATLRESLK